MAQAIRIGLLNDMARAGPAPGDVDAALALAIDRLRAQGRLDRPVEFVRAYGLGLPGGSAAAVERAFAALDAADVLMVVGPAIGDNALVATPLAERCRLPTLNWAGAERARGDFMFHLQVGSHEDESLVIARHLAGLGCGRIAVAFDRSPIGRRHFEFLRDEAGLCGLRITAVAALSPLAEHADDEVAELVGAAPDGFVYLGLGLSAPAVARALATSGWDGPRIMNTAGIRGQDPAFARVIDGWRYIDMFADDNRELAALRAGEAGDPAYPLALAKGHDLGRLVAEALARAPSLTREGVRLGLEAIKWLPAAEGHEGTLLGFGIHDRGALHGRYLVLREWREGRSRQLPGAAAACPPR